MKNWCIIFSILGIYFSTSLSAQTTISGIVIDATTSEPLIGASIAIRGTAQGDVSDVDGKFLLKINTTPITIEVSYTGYATQVIENPQDGIRIELVEAAAFLDPIFVPTFRRFYDAQSYTKLDILHNVHLPQNDVTIANALNIIPGVLMHNGALNTNRITIRGIGNRSPFSTNKIKAYLNDIPLTTGSGETTIEDIDLSFIKNVEVYKGPSGSIYGAGLGGMIQMNSVEGYGGSSHVGVQSMVGDFGLLRNIVNTKVQKKFGNTRASLHLNYNATHSDGYRENNEYDRTGFTALSHVKWKEDELSFLINFLSLKAFIPSSLNENDYLTEPTKAAFTWRQVMGFEDYDRMLAGISYKKKFSATTNMKYALFLNQKDAYESRPFNILSEKSTSLGARVLLNLKQNDSKMSFKVGTELFRENYDWQTYVTNDGVQGDALSDNEEIRSYANLFSEGTYIFNTNWKANAGVNFNTTAYNLTDLFTQDTIDLSGKLRFEPVVSPRLSLSYNPKNNVDYYLLVSHGFSPPSLEETLAPDGSKNPDIRPERGWNFEIGTGNYNYRKSTPIYYEVSLFAMLVDDLLVARRTALDQYIGINAGKTTHIGLEVFLLWKILNKSIFDLSLKTNYTYSNFSFKEFVDDGEDYSGNDLTGTPPHNLNTSLEWRFHFLRARRVFLYGDFNFQYLDSQPLTDANTVYSDAYSLLHAKIGIKGFAWDKISFQIYGGINNVLDEQYAAMFQINARSFGGNAPRYFYPGLPRNAFGGLKVAFYFR